ncbi:MAG: 2-dehydropantoate 2-reductase [Ectothiorhodospiraceae bacterium]|nr:2-dehydropantoate 2-reductase [Ectothiorhodospiraceae bacterium]
MRFAIYGAGGLGGYYGARLAAAGHEVGFVARGAHLAAMREGGLRVVSPKGDLHLAAPRASADPADIGPVDVVLVAVKTWQIPEVARAMGPLLAPDTVVVPFLNGVEAPDELAAVVGAERVLGGLSKIFSLVDAPGVIRHINPSDYLAFGELAGGGSARVEALRAVLADAGLEVEVLDAVREALWRKLLMVTSWSALGALARSPMGVMRGQPETRALIERSMAEGIAVAAAQGFAIDLRYRAELWAFYDALPAEATSSMMRDLWAGKPSELEAWNGAIVRFGERAGVATPVHALAYHLLLPMERRARGLLD